MATGRAHSASFLRLGAATNGSLPRGGARASPHSGREGQAAMAKGSWSMANALRRLTWAISHHPHRARGSSFGTARAAVSPRSCSRASARREGPGPSICAGSISNSGGSAGAGRSDLPPLPLNRSARNNVQRAARAGIEPRRRHQRRVRQSPPARGCRGRRSSTRTASCLPAAPPPRAAGRVRRRAPRVAREVAALPFEASLETISIRRIGGWRVTHRAGGRYGAGRQNNEITGRRCRCAMRTTA